MLLPITLTLLATFTSVTAVALPVLPSSPSLPSLPSLPTTSSSSTASPSSTAIVGPVVNLSYGSFVGVVSNNPNTSVVNSWRSMPYAQPPIGDLRLRKPLLPLNFTGVKDATSYRPYCTQTQTTAGVSLIFDNEGLPSYALDLLENQSPGNGTPSDGEDCLNINVVQPVTNQIPPVGGWPVFVWIYGGGFSNGHTSQYEGTPIVQRSIDIKSPVIFVAMEYRLNAFGFLAGQQLQDEGVMNLGLYDQRAALRWVQKEIHAFGGDKKRVTIFGESAGGISVALQMTINGGDNEGLFIGAWSFSGAPIPFGPAANGQKYFDSIVSLVGCSAALDAVSCLRTTDFEVLRAAMDQQPGIFAYSALVSAWNPRQDGPGGFLPGNNVEAMKQGIFSKVPLVSGDCDDEGTLFSFQMANITTDAQCVEYFRENFFSHANDSEIAALASFYPDDQAQGSPYGTGYLNSLYPQFKRIASFQGDLAFQAVRTFFLKYTTQKTWSYAWRRNKAVPVLGSFHGSELITDLFTSSYSGVPANRGGVDFQLMGYTISFANTQNPNSASTASTGIFWPTYNSQPEGAMLSFSDLDVGVLKGLSITLDTYRLSARAYLMYLLSKYPI